MKRQPRQTPYATLVAENARLRRELAQAQHDLKHANETLADWRVLLVENDLVEATPREELWYLISGYGYPPMRLDSGRIVGGCEHAWAGLMCHGLTDAEVSELNAREDRGLITGIHPREITPGTDPRCSDCRRNGGAE